MKKRYLVVILLLFSSMLNAKALTMGDCEVLASYKLYSSLDEENYICKGKEFGSSMDAIYYSGKGSTINLNNLDAYYLTNWEEYDVTLNISGTNNISLLHISDSKFKVKGSGSLKFKQNSFVKKVVNGQPVYQYVYNGKMVLNSDKKIYEGMTLEFEENYELLKKINNLPDKYNLEDYVLVQAIDYTKMTSVVVTESWIENHIDTDLSISIEDGFGIVKYLEQSNVEEAPETTGKEAEEKNNQLTTDNVILISDKKVNKKYELKEENLKDQEVANKVSEKIEKDLVSFYDVSVYNGKKQVSMKNGKYTIKIKLDSDVDKYENYQIIYVNDNGEIEEYIDGYIEEGYIVFETSHLSQYGVIASPIKVDSTTIEDIVESNKSEKLGNIFKISILVIFILGAILLLTFVIIKSGMLNQKKKRKKA
ncbi:MAG: hypothetical protein ACI4XM_02810 [Candidatus Coprovivens sp.]